MKRVMCLALLLALAAGSSRPARAQADANAVAGAVANVSRPARAQEQEDDLPRSPIDSLCWPRLRRNSSGENTRAFQRLLRARGYRVAADGRFGAQTVSAVKRFQRAHRLKVDGMVGWQTWAAVTPTLRSGSRGDAVRLLQTLLNGYDRDYKWPHVAPLAAHLRVDGVYGASTVRVVRRFQGFIGDPDGTMTGTADDFVWCYALGGLEQGV